MLEASSWRSRPEPRPAPKTQVKLLCEEGLRSDEGKVSFFPRPVVPLTSRGAREQGWALWSEAGEPEHGRGPIATLATRVTGTASAFLRTHLLPQPDEGSRVYLL